MMTLWVTLEFAAFPGFESVNAVFVTDAAQKAGDLTPSAPELSLK